MKVGFAIRRTTVEIADQFESYSTGLLGRVVVSPSSFTTVVRQLQILLHQEMKKSAFWSKRDPKQAVNSFLYPIYSLTFGKPRHDF